MEPWAGGAEKDGSLRPPIGAGSQALFKAAIHYGIWDSYFILTSV
jgi:hypothetical protein